jgi:hypothetical protein
LAESVGNILLQVEAGVKGMISGSFAGELIRSWRDFVDVPPGAV